VRETKQKLVLYLLFFITLLTVSKYWKKSICIIFYISKNESIR